VCRNEKSYESKKRAHQAAIQELRKMISVNVFYEVGMGILRPKGKSLSVPLVRGLGGPGPRLAGWAAHVSPYKKMFKKLLRLDRLVAAG